MLIEVRKQDNSHITISNDTYGQVICVGDASVLPDIGKDYLYLQWGDAGWYDKYYVDLTNTVQSFTDEDLVYLENIVTNWIQPLGQEGNPNDEQKLQAIIHEVQSHLDKQAQSLRYDNINAIGKYVGYANYFQTEAETLGAWASSCWKVAGQIEADVQSGERVIPTVDEVLAELPVYGA